MTLLKRCPTCNSEKPITEYQKRSTGLYSYCLPCRRSYDLKYKWRNIEKIRYWQRVRRKRDWKDPDKQIKIKQQANKWKQNNPDKLKIIQRESYLRWKDKKKLKREAVTGGIPSYCQACGIDVPKEKMVWDHNHSTGRFRGWLCLHCNVTIGMSKESVHRLTKLIEYLQRNV